MAQAAHRTDTQLKTAVNEELAWTPGLYEALIHVAVKHSAVTLSGKVKTFPEKRLAEHAALRVRGVTAVTDEILVHGSRPDVDDADLASQATEALDRAVNVPAGAVTATIHDHTITLVGQVPWQFQREAAEHSVRYLKGVTNVFNSITIRPTESVPDMKAAITAALVRSAQGEGRNTTVTVDASGAVALDGVVHSWSDRRDAEHVAWSAPGVTDVTNRLSVKG
jgi:osmotically-inducible protein OsmY